MAQTKRKRSNKHRGNAAGIVEVRGRTTKPPSKEERKKQAREVARVRREDQRPTWSSSFKKAGLAAGIMFVLMVFLGSGKGTNKLVVAILFAVFALALYTPLSFYLEMYMWRRRQSKKVAT